MATANELITKFKNMVDDELDSDYMLQLVNDAMHEVEEMAVWEVLKGKTTFTTNSVALPSEYGRILKLVEVESWIEYKQVPYEQQDIYDNFAYTYYIDYANSTVYLTDQQNTNSKALYYMKASDDLTGTDSWDSFPTRFHSILPYKMAEIYYAADAGEKQRAWDDRWASQYERMLNRMYQWNDSIKTQDRRLRPSFNEQPKGVEVDSRY